MLDFFLTLILLSLALGPSGPKSALVCDGCYYGTKIQSAELGNCSHKTIGADKSAIYKLDLVNAHFMSIV